MRLRIHKSRGEDGIQGEILKCMNEVMVENFYKLIEEIWKTEKTPEGWNLALIFVIHKKENRKEGHNYKGIALANVTYKIISYFILDI